MSVNVRKNGMNNNPSWFAGYLDREHYAIAVGGLQSQILGCDIPKEGFRGQYCVLGYVFTEKDIRFYRRDTEMFQNLKEDLLEIQTKKVEKVPSYKQKETSCRVDVDLSKFYLDTTSEHSWDDEFTILPASEENDLAAWMLSLKKPVLLSAVSEEDAKTFIDIFPSGIATVIRGQRINYHKVIGRKTLPNQLKTTVQKKPSNVVSGDTSNTNNSETRSARARTLLLDDRRRQAELDEANRKEIEEIRRKAEENPLPEHSGSDEWKDTLFGVVGGFSMLGITLAAGAKVGTAALTSAAVGIVSYKASRLINEKSEHRK